MPDLRPVLFAVGVILAMLGCMMLIPVAVDIATDQAEWRPFLLTAGFTLFTGTCLTIGARGFEYTLSVQQAFLLTNSVWLAVASFGALPFFFSDVDMSYTDAFFESMSGITTTGSTVITGLDGATHGLLIWRALLQWAGGLGIIVMAIAILPMLGVGGMQLFQIDSTGPDEKTMPRAAQITSAVSIIYLALTLLCTLALWLAGMTIFEAVAHAMTTIATGGYSTSDMSIGHFNSATIETVIILFMILGCLPFVLMWQALRGNAASLFRDSQIRAFLITVIGVILVMTLWRFGLGGEGSGGSGRETDFATILRFSAFNTVSILTGTGYSSADYMRWGDFAVVFFFAIMFIGGCAGSTSCGIKIFRFQVMTAAIRAQVNKLIRPHQIAVTRYNNKPVGNAVVTSIASFIFIFSASVGVFTLILTILGLDFLSALSGAGTAIANVGPGLGDIIGPAGTFASLPDSAKWVLSLGMLLGRLELLTVLVLFSLSFWRR